MRRATIFLFLALAVLPASARGLKSLATNPHFHTSPACDVYLAKCKSKFPDNAQGCATLFEAAKASGGVWGEPAARAAAHFPGHRILYCLP